MNSSCPTSTPTLKNSSAMGMSFSGSPTCAARRRSRIHAAARRRTRRPRARSSRVPGWPCASRRISAATNITLSAMVASTGACGTCTQPERRRRERDAVRDGERRDGRDESPPVADQEQQAEHEQQVIDAEQDVLDAEHEVGLRHLEAVGRGGHLERRAVGREAHGLRRAVETLDAREHVGPGRAQAFDRDRPADQAARAPRLPSLDERATRERALVRRSGAFLRQPA